jgi:hypothetical protein
MRKEHTAQARVQAGLSIPCIVLLSVLSPGGKLVMDQRGWPAWYTAMLACRDMHTQPTCQQMHLQAKPSAAPQQCLDIVKYQGLTNTLVVVILHTPWCSANAATPVASAAWSAVRCAPHLQQQARCL